VVRGENKLLQVELPRDRRGRFRFEQNGAVVASAVNQRMPPEPQPPPAPPPPPPPPLILPPVLATLPPISEAKRIDVISRVMFPLSFAGFNVMYWAYYLTRSAYTGGAAVK